MSVSIIKTIIQILIIGIASAFFNGQRAFLLSKPNVLSFKGTYWKASEIKIIRVRGFHSLLKRFSGVSTSDAVNSVGSNHVNLNEILSHYSVGQIIDAEVKSVHIHGALLDIGKPVNALIPKSYLSIGQFHLLRDSVKLKSKNRFLKVEITNITSPTIYCKIAPIQTKQLVSNAQTGFNYTDIINKQYNGTVVSIHDFGVFVRLVNGTNVQGLVPIANLPLSLAKTYRTELKKGDPINVKVQQANATSKKIWLTARVGDDEYKNAPSLPIISPEVWTKGVVKSVTSYALYLRPVGMDVNGMLHISRIPIELLDVLNDYAQPASNSKSELQSFFSVGDVLRFRIESYDSSNNPILSSLPIPPDEDEIASSSVSDFSRDYDDKRRSRDQIEDEEEDFRYPIREFDPLNVLMWWRNAPFEVAVNKWIKEEMDKTEDERLIEEHEAAQPGAESGTYRRLFELDMMRESQEFNDERLASDFEKEIDEEIGVLHGLDKLLEADHYGMEIPCPENTVGRNIDGDLPQELRDRLAFYREQDNIDRKYRKLVTRDKAKLKWYNRSELDKLLRFIESDPTLSGESARKSGVIKFNFKKDPKAKPRKPKKPHENDENYVFDKMLLNDDS